MSYITHSKDEFNRPVCKKRKQKRTGLYIQSSPSFRTFTLTKPFYFSIDNINMQCLRFFG